MTTDLRSHPLNDKQQRLARQIDELLDKARYNLEISCAFSSQLENVDGTHSLSGLHELHVYSLFPVSYHLTTAAGAARIISKGKKWTMPLIMLVYGCAKNTVDFMQYFYPESQKMLDALNKQSDQPWFPWAEEVANKSVGFGNEIEKPCKDAMSLAQELIGMEAFQQMMMDGQKATQDLKEYRMRTGLHLTTTIGISGLQNIPGYEASMGTSPGTGATRPRSPLSITQTPGVLGQISSATPGAFVYPGTYLGYPNR